MKSAVLCGLLALAMGATIQDKLSLKAGDTTGTSTSSAGLMTTSSSKSILQNGETLGSTMSLISPDGHTSLQMQADGNLVVSKDGTALWTSGTSGNSGAYLSIESDGNLVIYNGNDVKWTTNIFVGSATYLQVQDDTNVVLLSTNIGTVWSSNSGKPGSTLQSGAKLLSPSCLFSPDGHTILAMQSDGSLVVSHDGTALWSSGTSGNSGAYLSLESNGNLVIYNGNNVKWTTNIFGGSGSYLQVQDDTNVVLYIVGGGAVWSWKNGKPGSTLQSGAKLQSSSCLVSPDAHTILAMQGDGNLVVYHNGTPRWASGTNGKSGAYLTLESDGNLVVYKGSSAKWSTNSFHGSGSYLQVQDDTNVVIYIPGGWAVWSWKNGKPGSTLQSGAKLLSPSCLFSPDGHTMLAMQSDGNLVVYKDGTSLWASDTWGNSGAYLSMESTGNLVVYNGSSAKWSANVFGGSATYLQVQDDTNVVIYIPGGGSVWSWKNGKPGSTLQSGAKLLSSSCLISPDAHTILAMQSDGNLVIYHDGTVLWASGRNGQSGVYLTLESDGNLVIYNANSAMWATNTRVGSGSYLKVQDDTKAVLYNDARIGAVLALNYGKPGSTLQSGAKLQSSSCLVSPDGHTILAMQSDGNLVVYKDGTLLWTSGTSGNSGAYLSMESTGNLVVYKGSSAKWSANVFGGSATYLQVQDDTNVVLINTQFGSVWSWKNGKPGSTLQSGAKLQSSSCLVSPNGHTILAMQSDGNLVVYKDGTSLWTSGTSGNSGAYLTLESDGNLVVYNGSSAKWSANSFRSDGSYLQVQDDTNVVLISVKCGVVWSSENGKTGSTLQSRAKLQSPSCLFSPDGHTILAMQSDGNLVVYKDGTSLWTSGTSGNSGAYLSMESTGNLVVYNGSSAKWSANVFGGSATYLQVQDDTNVVLINTQFGSVWSWKNGKPGSTLQSGAKLQSSSCLFSPDGHTILAMQSDGNLVVYKDGTSLWASGTNGQSGAYLSMESTGNLVVYNGSSAKWSANVFGGSATYLQVQDDTNVVLINTQFGSVWSWKNGKPGSTLQSGAKLLSLDCLVSPDGHTILAMEKYGNLVVYKDGTSLWTSGTSGNSGAYLSMESTGNLVVYNGSSAKWSANVFGGSATYLQVQDDTNVVIYIPGGGSVWSWKNGKPGSTLQSGAKLLSSSCLISPDAHTILAMQSDGNLVIYHDGTVLWVSGTNGQSGAYLTLESDGNLVIYNANSAMWATNTRVGSGSYLKVQDDTKAVLYNDARIGAVLALNYGKPGSTLQSGAKLQSSSCLVSPDGHTILAMQSDGNLVVYKDGTLLWTSGTSGNSGAYLSMESTGNLVVYKGSSAKWSANVFGGSATYLQVQDDTNVVIYIPGGGSVWSWKNGKPGSTLKSGAKLQSPNCLVSPNGHTILAMQGDGNLVIYHDGTVNWSAGTNGNPGAYLSMQSDGNLVIYNGSSAKWATNIFGGSGTYLQVQDDTNVFIYISGGGAVWSSNNGKRGNTLQSGAKLLSLDCLVSPDGHTILAMEKYGNLVVYKDGTSLWTSGTSGNSGAYLSMESTGNLVVYNGSSAKWSANVFGGSATYLQVQDDTNVVLINTQFGSVWSWKNGKSGSTLQSGAKLLSSSCLISPDAHTILAMQSDGNLVIYHDGTPLWASGTNGQSGAYLTLESDGNLVIYNANSAKWATNTRVGSGSYLKVQDDTKAVLYNDARIGAVLALNYGKPGSYLQSGAKLLAPNCLVSPDGHTVLVMQTDGNLVIYNNGHVNWSTRTDGNPGAYVIMQSDGNLVVYLGSTARWATATDKKNGAYLRLQDDQNLVVYDKNGSPSYWTPSTGRQY